MASSTKLSSKETAAKIKSLLNQSLQEERLDAARLDELRRIFAALVQQGDLTFGNSPCDNPVQQKWNSWLLKRHDQCVQQLTICIREENRRTAVRTLWGMIAASPVVYREQGNHPCVHRELLREWLSAIVAMPLDITQDKSMLHLLEAELRQRDVQYFSVCVITKWANDQYEIAAEGHKAEGKDADEDEGFDLPQLVVDPCAPPKAEQDQQEAQYA